VKESKEYPTIRKIKKQIIMRKGLLFLMMIQLFACTSAELQNTLGGLLKAGSEITSQEAGLGLKEALNIGITKGAEKLSQTDGYYKSLYKNSSSGRSGSSGQKAKRGTRLCFL
jgi:hypothetical protein